MKNRNRKRRFVAKVESMEKRFLLSTVPQFTIKDLLAYAQNASDINSSGHVIGTLRKSPSEFGAASSNGNMLVPIGIWQSVGLGINDIDQVLGIDYGSNVSYSRAFICSNGTITYITPAGENINGSDADINNLGNATVSIGPLATQHAFLYDGALHDIGTLGGVLSRGMRINDSNQIVGVSYTSSGNFHAFFYDGAMHDLGTFGGANSWSGGINSSGQVTGGAWTTSNASHAFLSDPHGGALHDLGLIENSTATSGFSVNDQGHVVGEAQVGNDIHAFYYNGQDIADLNYLIPQDSGFVITEAYGINSSDQIAALGVDNSGVYHALLLTPIPPTPVAPTITWSNPADIVYGTPLSATQLNATASVPGTFTYSIAAGTVLHAGASQTLTATFTPDDTTDYTTDTATASINVLPAPLTVTANNARARYGLLIPPLTGTITGLVNGDTDVATYTTTAVKGSWVGDYPIVPHLTDPNYNITFVNGTLVISW